MDIENQIEEEIEEETTEVVHFFKLRDIAADTFTPYKIKDLSGVGKRNMGCFGLVAFTSIGVIVTLDLYGLIVDDQSAIVIINVLIPIVFSLLSLAKLIAAVLHFLFKSFK